MTELNNLKQVIVTMDGAIRLVGGDFISSFSSSSSSFAFLDGDYIVIAVVLAQSRVKLRS